MQKLDGKKQKIEKLSLLTREMDLPDIRRDFSKAENIRWFLRNAAIRNMNKPFINTAIDLAKELLQ